MAELDSEVQLKLIKIAEVKADAVTGEFQSKEAERDAWIKNFGDIYKKLVKAIAE